MEEQRRDVVCDGQTIGWAVVLMVAAVGVSGCQENDPREQLRQRLDERGIEPLEAPAEPSEATFELGRMLFFDPLLSGNRDISCATCHHPSENTVDGRSLSVGTDWVRGANDRRVPGPEEEFVPRNAQGLYNLGHDQWRTNFRDRRLERVSEGSFVYHRHAGNASAGRGALKPLSGRFDNIVAAQAVIPLTGRDEMRGDVGDTDRHGEPNEIGAISSSDFEGVWSAVMKRLRADERYRKLFAAAFEGVDPSSGEGMTIVQVGNALAAFQIEAFTFLDSPWDRFLEGDSEALSPKEARGGLLFYGKAGCGECHSGALMTDQKAHNIGVPQIGPGKMPGAPLDQGASLRAEAADSRRFAFRTPPLRHVSLTGPYMHNGAYASLEGAVRHHLEPDAMVRDYRAEELEPRLRGWTHTETVTRRLIDQTRSPLLAKTASVDLSDREFQQLIAFLRSLTSPKADDTGHLVPVEVPSGLPMVDP